MRVSFLLALALWNAKMRGLWLALQKGFNVNNPGHHDSLVLRGLRIL